MKKNKISKNWINKQNRDKFVKQSKAQGFRSRSSFKLIEMNEKFNFLNKNISILDLGSAPGGWSQIVAKKVVNGKILAIDLKPMEKINNVNFINGNFTDKIVSDSIFEYFDGKIDVVISDMAENTSGNKDLDSYRTGELCIKAMEFSQKILNKNGVFLSKLFMGSIFEEIHKKANKYFKKVIKYKPLASRPESKEIYIYCKGISKV